MRPVTISIVLSVLLATDAAAAAQAEPNKVELKFETDSQQKLWTVKVGKSEEGEPLYCDNPGSIEPTYVAEVVIKRTGKEDSVTDAELSNAILNSRIAQSLSQRQRDFIATGFAFRLDYESLYKLPDHCQTWLYAISEEDARKMVQAFIDFLNKKAKARLEQMLQMRDGLKGKVSQTQKQYLEIKAQFEAIGADFEKKLKDGRHFLNLDGGLARGMDTPKEAKQTVLEMNKVLDLLNIEIAGIEAKLAAIEELKSRKSVSGEGLAKLEQILCEQTIELAGALARKKASLEIRTREEQLYNLYRKWENLSYEVQKLDWDISTYEENLGELEEKLANPDPGTLPPTILQNKVTIYPVRIERTESPIFLRGNTDKL